MPTNAKAVSLFDFVPKGKIGLALSCLSSFNQTVSSGTNKPNHSCVVRMLYLMSEYPTSVSIEVRDKDNEPLVFFIEDITKGDLRLDDERYTLKNEAVDRIMSKLTESME
jgi:hypothetical protein|nr:MAG TPA: hypothetical protein [Caudoviricetes sp.]